MTNTPFWSATLRFLCFLFNHLKTRRIYILNFNLSSVIAIFTSNYNFCHNADFPSLSCLSVCIFVCLIVHVFFCLSVLSFVWSRLSLFVNYFAITGSLSLFLTLKDLRSVFYIYFIYFNLLSFLSLHISLCNSLSLSLSVRYLTFYRGF